MKDEWEYSNAELLETTGMALGQIMVRVIGREHCDLAAMRRLDDPGRSFWLVDGPIRAEILRLQEKLD